MTLGSLLEEKKARMEGRQTIFSLNYFGENPDEEEPSNGLSVPSKVHHLSNLEVQPRCCLLGKIVPRTRTRIAILTNEVKCNNCTQSRAG